MTTARERYEQKTKVITFRVTNEVYDQIEEAKARTGLSNADLIKLGAGISQEEIKEKLGHKSGLDARLAEISRAIEGEVQRLNEERQRQRGEMDKELRAYRLFSAGWGVEETAFKLSVPGETVRRFFEEWAKAVEEREVARQELLRGYLKKHLGKLRERRLWVNLLPSYTEKNRGELEEQIDFCAYLLSHPSEVNEEWAQFLIAEYSEK